MDFRLRVNHKKRSTVSSPERDKQFRYIGRMRNAFDRRGEPVMSVDSKKKELVGNFKNAGAAWKQKATETLDHDFPSDAEGVAIPYGLYDTSANRGFVVVGTSRETPAFAVDCHVKWWQVEGQQLYPHTKRILILADGGGGNRSPQQKELSEGRQHIRQGDENALHQNTFNPSQMELHHLAEKFDELILGPLLSMNSRRGGKTRGSGPEPAHDAAILGDEVGFGQPVGEPDPKALAQCRHILFVEMGEAKRIDLLAG